ncbi:unnamed protein product [Phyllotreta striolata]|uniref:Glutamate receptor ionotropic, kainate 2-like n=1 Tax=Phyllotreta striolata TaxID=444603 RepID=A0A9N9TZH9_PHYSR|nr:unnamed protein product [Phyllotreta striolata]
MKNGRKIATMISKVVLVFWLAGDVSVTRCANREKFNIGGIFSDEIQEAAFKISTSEINRKHPESGVELVPLTVLVPPTDVLETYKTACDFLRTGIVGLFGPSSAHSSPYVQAICDAKEIPHVETRADFAAERNESLVNVHPHPGVLARLFKDLVRAFEWRRLVVLYEGQRSLLELGSLLEFNNRKGRKVVLRKLESVDKGNYRAFLSEVKSLGETNFVLACSVDVLEEVLKQLQQVGMMTESYSYIITDLNAQTLDLTAFQYAGTNITAVRMLDPEQIEIMEMAESLQKQNAPGSDLPVLLESWKTKLETVLLFDAVELFHETLRNLTVDGKKKIRSRRIDCDGPTAWNDGYSIINLMKSTRIRGLTGDVEFDVKGFRTNFAVDVLELSLGGLIKIAEWNSTARKLRFQRPQKQSKPEDRADVFNTTLTVLISINPPYQMLKETTEKLAGNERYEGFGIDVIDELSRLLGFNYTLIEQEDGSYGVMNKTTGKWDGMMGAIIDGKADLAITDLTITSERESAVDFSEPFMNLGISILYRKPEPVPPSLFMFVSPFSFTVWFMLCVSYLIVSIAIFIMGRLSPSEWQNPYPCIEEPQHLINQFSIRNSFWFTIGALMQQGSELAPISISTRTVSGFWWFFILTMVSSYTANLAAFLTVTTLVAPFKDIDELAEQKEIEFGAKNKGATANYFRDSNLTKYKKIWSYMVHHPELMLDDNDQAVKKVQNENYAFLMESTTIEYVIERHCTLAQVGGLLDDKGYGIAMKKFSPYRNDISTAILQLQEKGVLTSRKIKWWKEKRGGGKCSAKAENSEATALDLQNVGGVFLVLFVGSILGVFGSLAEFTYHIYRRTKREKVPFKEEFKKELKFLAQFKQNVRETNRCATSSDKNLIDNDKYNFQ